MRTMGRVIKHPPSWNRLGRLRLGLKLKGLPEALPLNPHQLVETGFGEMPGGYGHALLFQPVEHGVAGGAGLVLTLQQSAAGATS
jgi:hypothetical protein